MDNCRDWDSPDFDFFGWPWLKWHTSTYTVTNRRIITRRGIISKTGHDIPLSRISNVAYEYDFIDRIFGCGTLVLETSADDPLELRDVPKAEELHVQLTELLFNTASDPGAAVNELDY
ncbi:PH domain-containing protein [Arcanobacterium hippocoleae]